jgi:glutathione S-transferase
MPTLVLPDGTTMTDTVAILQHLTGYFPDAKWHQHQGRWRTENSFRWVVFANVNLREAVARRGYQFRYTDDENGYEAVRSAAIRRMGEALEVLEAAITDPFLLGNDMTIASVYAAMFYIRSHGDVDTPRLDALTDKI